MDVWESFKDKVEKFEAAQAKASAPMDKDLDNIERQGFSMDSNSTWHSTQGDDIRKKAVFDLEHTNPHTDIIGTGDYEIWVRNVEQVNMSTTTQPTDRDTPISQENQASLPQITTVKAACVYNPGGKCIGMVTPERLHLLRKCFENAQNTGIHAQTTPPVHSFASELAGLLLDNNRLLDPKHSEASDTIRESHSPVMPDSIFTALYDWACVTKEKMASALDFSPQVTSYWSSRHRDRVFGANYDALATKFTGFSVCHPEYSDAAMYKCLHHAIYSAMDAETPTATFLLLPNWANRASILTCG